MVTSMQETGSAGGYGYTAKRKKHGVDYYVWYCCLLELLLLMFDMPRNIPINSLAVLVPSAVSPPQSREICQTSLQLRLKASGPCFNFKRTSSFHTSCRKQSLTLSRCFIPISPLLRGSAPLVWRPATMPRRTHQCDSVCQLAS